MDIGVVPSSLELVEVHRDEPETRLFINSFRYVNGKKPSINEVRDHLKCWSHSLIKEKHYLFYDSW